MANHVMGPSNVSGFKTRCIHCGAFDTEIIFALGQHCDKAPVVIPEPEKPKMAVNQSHQPRGSKASEVAAYLQANWFQGYFARQYARCFPR